MGLLKDFLCWLAQCKILDVSYFLCMCVSSDTGRGQLVDKQKQMVSWKEGIK